MKSKCKKKEKELQELQSQAKNLLEKEKAQQTNIEWLRNKQIEVMKENENRLKELEREHHRDLLKTIENSAVKAANEKFEKDKRILLENMKRCEEDYKKEQDDLLRELKRSRTEKEYIEQQKGKK